MAVDEHLVLEYTTPNWEPEKLLPLFQLVKEQSLHFQGIVNAATSRGEAYSFMRMGKYLERAEKTARVLDVYYNKSTVRFQSELSDYHHWISVLKSVCGYEPYLREHHSFVEPKNVAEFLIFNENFPRSIRFCIQQVMDTFMDLLLGQLCGHGLCMGTSSFADHSLESRCPVTTCPPSTAGL